MQPIIPESSQHWMTAELISPSSLWVSWLTPTVNGTHYGIPFDNGATIMAIRSDMVEAAGLKVEDFKDTTWSEFMELAKKVMAANDVPMLTCSGGSEIVIEMLQSAGAFSHGGWKGDTG